MTNKTEIVYDGKATAEELAKKIEECIKSDLVGFTKREGATLTFTLAGGQSFSICVTEN